MPGGDYRGSAAYADNVEHVVGDSASLSLVSVLAGLEREFRVQIDNEELSRMTDIGGIRAVLADAAGW